MNRNQELLNYIQTQLAENEERLLVKLDNQSIAGNPLSPRELYKILQDNINNFLNNLQPFERWIIMPGLRGVGKTTLMIQIFLWLKQVKKIQNVIYISLDEIIALADLKEVLATYEQLLGEKFYQLKKPVFILIDEIQFDSSWAEVLKIIYDWNENVYILCTGSSSVNLQMGADIHGRRAQICRVFPLNFREYQLIYHQIPPNHKLSRRIFDILYCSANAQEVYDGLIKISGHVDQQWTVYKKNSLDHYFDIGTMPFAFYKESFTAYEALKNMMQRILTEDIRTNLNPQLNTLHHIEQLIQILADSGDFVETNKLTNLLQISRVQLLNILDALVKAEFLTKIPACGTNITVSRQPVKYTFMSPAMRVAQRSIKSTKAMRLASQGLVLEDIAALHYHREFTTQGKGLLTHPYNKKGEMTDFILKTTDNQQIAIEFGLGNKNTSQAIKTMKKFPCKYSLIFSKTDVKLDPKLQIINIPLDYFFLI